MSNYEIRKSDPLGDDCIRKVVLAIKRRMHRSWDDLLRGCLDLLGRDVAHATSKVAASSRAFARNVSNETGLNCEQILTWLNAPSL